MTLKQLREIAERATPGEWDAAIHRKVHGSLGPLDAWHAMAPNVREERAKNDANYLEAANPATVLALLDSIKDLTWALAQCAQVKWTVTSESTGMVQSGETHEASIARQALEAHRRRFE